MWCGSLVTHFIADRNCCNQISVLVEIILQEKELILVYCFDHWGPGLNPSQSTFEKNLRSWRGGQDPTLIIECLGSSPSQVKFFCLMVLVMLVQMHYLNLDLFVY